jgi:hypothetical protein
VWTQQARSCTREEAVVDHTQRCRRPRSGKHHKSLLWHSSKATTLDRLDGSQRLRRRGSHLGGIGDPGTLTPASPALYARLPVRFAEPEFTGALTFGSHKPRPAKKIWQPSCPAQQGPALAPFRGRCDRILLMLGLQAHGSRRDVVMVRAPKLGRS